VPLRLRRDSRPAPDRGARPVTAYNQLRDLIVRGRLAPGSPLVETDLADRLGVSRTPIRSALERLHHQGLITAATGARLFKYVVAPLTRADGRALYHVIAELDGLAAHDAALLARDERRQLAASMRGINDGLRRAARTGRLDPARLYELDRTFHHHYMDAASPRLRALYQVIEGHEERYARVYFVMLLPDAIDTFTREHDAITRAVARGDPTRAQQAARTNWRNAADRLAVAIDRIGERGGWQSDSEPG